MRTEASWRGTVAVTPTTPLTYTKNNSQNPDVKPILRGWHFAPADEFDFTNATTKFWIDDFGGQMPVLTWSNEPTNLMSTLAITFAGTNYQCLFPQLQGQRLSLTFDSAGLAQLWLDDSNAVQHATSGGNGNTNVVLAITHPFGYWDTNNNAFVPDLTNNFGNQTVTNSYQSTNSTYAFLYAFDPDWGWLQQRQNMLDAYLQQGLTNGSRQMTSATLNVMGLNWMLQTARVDGLLSAQMGILPQFHHRLGRMGQEAGKGYYVDVYMQLDSSYPDGGDDTAHLKVLNNKFDLWVFFGSALEHGIIEELQNTNLVGASTIKMLQLANTNSQAIYLASSTNWTTGFNVRSKLTNYDASVLNTLTNLINSSYFILLPQNGSNTVAPTGNWAGYGYEARLAYNLTNFETRMIISGGYHGGWTSDSSAIPDASFTAQSGVSQPGSLAQTPSDL